MEIEKHIGPKNVALIREVWNKVSVLLSEGPMGLWNMMKDFGGEIKKTPVAPK